MPDRVKEKLVELLAKYFDIGDSYAYNLTRVKSAFACGTMGFDDFEEFDEETVADIADHLIAHGVTVQEWISVKDGLPENDYGKHWKERKYYLVRFAPSGLMCVAHYGYKEYDWWIDEHDCVLSATNFKEVTHWMEITNFPQPPKGE